MKNASTRCARWVLQIVLLLACSVARAGYVPVAVTGFNADVVANGSGSSATSTTADMDGANNVLMAPDFVNPAGLAPATALPADGAVYSQATSGVRFQMASYSSPNSLRLAGGANGTLTFPAPQNLSASEIFLLATAGSGGTSGLPYSATITFTDGTTQVFSTASGTLSNLADWTLGLPSYAIRGLGQVKTTTDHIANDWGTPYLYEVRLTLSQTNYAKQIASITIAHLGTTGFIQVMGVAANTLSACATPAQATALAITPSSTSATISFSAAAPPANKYLVVRSQGGPLNTVPVNGTAYTIGAALGNGTVVGAGAGVTVTDGGLAAGTLYYYTVFAYNDICTGGPLYNTTNAPTTSASTTSVTTGGLTNIDATGYNADVVANGPGSAGLSTNAAIDGANNVFMAPDFVNPSGVSPTTFLPANGIINVAAVPGLSFNLQPYGGNNALRLSGVATPVVLSGTLTPITQFSASQIYLLVTAGDAGTNPGSTNDTVFFTDGTYQAFTNQTFPDWFSTTAANVAISGVGRANSVSNNVENSPIGGNANPRLFYLLLTINPSNYNKTVASIGVAKTAATNSIPVLMGIAANVLPPCTAPAAQATALVLTPSTTQIAGGFTAAAGAPNKYLVVRTPGTTPLSATPANGSVYTVGSILGNGTIVSAGTANTFADGGLTQATQYTYTVFAYNDACNGGPVYQTTVPLTGTATTTNPGGGGGTYTWTGATNFTYTVPTNWSPARISPDPSDILLFNNSQTNAVYDVVTQTVRRIVISNNTTVLMQPLSTAGAVTLMLASDGVSSTDELNIATGSTLLLNGSRTAGNTQTLAFSGTGGTATIAGILNAYSIAAAGANLFDFANAVTTVASGGTLGAGGNSTVTSFTNSTTTNLLVNGTLRHNYHLAPLPAIPVATYGAGSTVLIRGGVTATTPPGGLTQTFSNLTYDCRMQGGPNTTPVAASWSSSGPLNVTGTFTMVSSGIGSLVFTDATAYTYTVGNFTQTGGTLNLAGGSAGGVLNVSGAFNQAGGTFFSSSTAVLPNAPVLNFNGTTVQPVSFFNAAPTGPITYRISNPAGITLTGTGTLTGAFALNTGGGVRISTTAAAPITTALTLTYAATGSTLTYDAPGAVTATTNVFPTANGPANLAINTGAQANAVTLPSSRTVPGTLTMTSGDIVLGGNILTLGTSATQTGTLAYVSGFVRVTTGGSFVRWYGATGLPTALANSGGGFYPISYNNLPRFVSVAFSANNALASGGSIGVQHNHVQGFTNGLSVLDGAYLIDTRTNSSWSFTTGGGIALAGTNTVSLALTGTGLFVSSNPANLRVMKAASVAGTHQNGAGTTANRTGLTFTDLAQPHYIGANGADITGVYIAINTGNWNVGSNWDIGTPPGVANVAFINPGVTINAPGTSNTAKSLTVLLGGTLNLAAGETVTLDSALQNAGTVNLTGGTLNVKGVADAGIINTGTLAISSGQVTLGTVAGVNNRAFSQNGTLTVSGGTLTINGSMSTVLASVNNQTGGDIIVDGNAGGVLTNSVPCSRQIVVFQNVANNLSGGTFTIVDPHACTTGANTMAYINQGNSAASGTHVFRMGNGAATEPGGSASSNFAVNTSFTGKFAFNDLVINTSGTAANSYVVQGATTMGVVRDFTVSSGEFRNSSAFQATYVGRDLTVNTGSTFTSLGTLVFGNFATGTVAAATNAQVVSGGGAFRNSVSATPAARFQSIQVNNSSAGGVRFAIGDARYAGTLNLTLGRLFMTGGSTLIQNTTGTTTGAGQNTGWVVGKFQRGIAATGTINHDYIVGDSLYYTPLTITGTLATTGDILVSTQTPDHPNLGTSGINPGRSVNRWWNVQQLNGLTFTNAATTVKPTWNAADLDVGTTPANFILGRYASTAWTLPPVSSQTATSIIGTQTSGSVSGDYAVGEACAPPLVTTQPQPQTVCVGGSATFSVTLSNGGSTTVQWLRNGSPVPGATTNPYTISNATLADAGTYTVQVTSGCASLSPVLSQGATLTVVSPPAFTTQPTSATRCEGQSVTFSAAVTGTVAGYQWQKNGVNILGATNASYTINNIVVADAGSYSVVVTGASPCSGTYTSAVATLTVNVLPLTITAASTTNFCTGGSVNLNATTGYTYQWLQNNTIIPGAVNATYTATTAGSYSVIVFGPICNDTSNAITVTVGTPPSTVITLSPIASFCAGSSVTLAGPTTSGLAYQWNFNGGAITGATSSTYAANAVGNYTVTVSLISNPACIATTPTPTAVSSIPLPTATATAAGPTSVCQGNTVTLNANTGTGLTYQWNLNSAPVSTGGTLPTYVATASGSYTVTVTNTATTCSNVSAPVTVSINVPPPANITTSGATTFCEGGSVTLNAPTGTGVSYVWYRNGSPVVPAATNPAYVANVSGSYTVVVTTNSTGCTNTSNPTVVTVNPVPVTTVTASGPLTLCTGGSVTLSIPTAPGQTYQWKLNGGNITGATAASYTATATGSYTVQATIISTGCTSTSVAQVVTVNPLPTATATAAGPTTVCSGTTVTLNANTGAGLTYQWRQAGTPIPGATASTYGATTSGTYTVTTTTAAGCSQTSNAITVTVNTTPTVSVASAAPVTFCEGSAVVLTTSTNIGVASYQWRINGVVIPGATADFFTATQSGSYTVSVVSAANCSAASAPLTVTVHPAPQPGISFSGSVLSTGTFASYQWFRNNAPIGGANGQTYSPTQPGTYYVLVVDANGCSGASESVYVSTAGIASANPKTGIRVYPNPVLTEVIIDAPVRVDATLRDLTGRRVMRVEDASTIDLRAFADGTYILTLTDKDGQLLKTERLTKRSTR